MIQSIKNYKYLKQRRKILRRNQTIFENTLWQELRHRRLLGLKFYRQFSVDHYILDFYCPEIRLCIEVDGGGHFETKQEILDLNRTKFLNESGIKVLRFTNQEVDKRLVEVLERIAVEITPPARPEGLATPS